MDTRKNVLEKLSDHELEQYIKPDSKFVPEAIQYAYEILQSRGKVFTEQEKERINSVISKTEENEATILHPNYTKASNLIYLSGAVGIGCLIWTYEQLDSELAIFISAVVLASVFGVGYMIGKGNEIAKFVFIILFILGLAGIPTLVTHLSANPVLGIMNILQFILQTWAIILLVKIPKSKKV